MTHTPHTASPLTPDAAADYRKHGIVRVKIPPGVDALRQAFLEECAAFVEWWAGVTVDTEDLPRALVDLARRDRALVGRLYKVARRFPAAKQIAAHPHLVATARQLMATELVSCCNFVCVRVDLPGEDVFTTPIHQDFPYIQGSLDGVTVWMPFHDLDAAHGIPSFVPESHEWGVVPVVEYALEAAGGSGGRSFRLPDDERLAEARFEQLASLGRDEALIFHTLLAHRSEPNISDEARISIQVRFDDLADARSFERGFPEGLYLNDRFRDTYPEYVIDSVGLDDEEPST